MSGDVLRAEHEALGATWADDDGAAPVLAYGDGEVTSFCEAGTAGLCDLSGLFVQLVEGDDAPSFVSAACAADVSVPGVARFSAVLAGDGAVVSVPLVARTGDREWVLLDATPRVTALAGWLDFLASVEQEGRAPFASVRLTDASDVHVPLALVGSAASAVLGDYVEDPSVLPAEGTVCPVALDGRIRSLCLRLPSSQAAPSDPSPGYLLLVPPSQAVVLWRSLLSFSCVVPMGRRALAAELSRSMPWLDALSSADRVVVAPSDLRVWGLVRDEPSFVGARAFASSERRPRP